MAAPSSEAPSDTADAQQPADEKPGAVEAKATDDGKAADEPVSLKDSVRRAMGGKAAPRPVHKPARSRATAPSKTPAPSGGDKGDAYDPLNGNL